MKITYLLLSSLFLLITACSEPQSGKKNDSDKIVIGISMLSMQNEFIVNISDEMQNKAKELGAELIIVDGEELLNGDDNSILKFIEAHEVSHILLDHSGPRNKKEELEADLGAYVILKHYGYKKPLELLLKHFESRHGMEFDESMIPEISNKLGLG